MRSCLQAFFDHVSKLANPGHFLEATVMQASRAVVDIARAHDRIEHPRTTVVAAEAQSGEPTALRSGDAHLYWVRAGRLVQRRRDHSDHDQPQLFAEQPAAVSRSVSCTCLGSETPPRYDVLEPASLVGAAAAPDLLPAEGLPAAEPEDAEIARTIVEISDDLRGIRCQTPLVTVPARSERKRPCYLDPLHDRR